MDKIDTLGYKRADIASITGKMGGEEGPRVYQDRYTNIYRTKEACSVMNWLKAGQSGCLIGLLGAGKSNFLRFLLQQETRQKMGINDENSFRAYLNLFSRPCPFASNLAGAVRYAIYFSLLAIGFHLPVISG